MTFMYFDESIRDDGSFIVGALVLSDVDLSRAVRNAWIDLGLNPDVHEYKSSAPKASARLSQDQRHIISSFLRKCRLGLVICPRGSRGYIGEYCIELVSQLIDKQHLEPGQHTIWVDQGIAISSLHKATMAKNDVMVDCNCDSRVAAGIQVADHAAHLLGVTLLQDMGLVSKRVIANEQSGYSPSIEIELGYELWAELRYTLIGTTVIDPITTSAKDPITPYRQVQENGLYIAPSCGVDLAHHALECFGSVYLGCIH